MPKTKKVTLTKEGEELSLARRAAVVSHTMLAEKLWTPDKALAFIAAEDEEVIDTYERKLCELAMISARYRESRRESDAATKRMRKAWDDVDRCRRWIAEARGVDKAKMANFMREWDQVMESHVPESLQDWDQDDAPETPEAAQLQEAVAVGTRYSAARRDLDAIRESDALPKCTQDLPDEVLPALAALRLHLLKEGMKNRDLPMADEILYEMTSEGIWHQFLVIYGEREVAYEVEDRDGQLIVECQDD